ncbi:MAG: Ig-like domain-containing protein [Bacteroidales bacterium]
MKKIIFFIVTTFFLSSCAKIVMPIGGPKDTNPPVVIKEFPENKSTHFNSKQIKLTFNEFVVLNNPNQNILFSPPLSKDPEFGVINKSVIVKLPDTLQPNTTYNVVFSNCIKDFTEGNPIPYYNYVFSTGAYVDSFTVRGKLINAETLKPEPNCFVFLYQDNIDSLPKTSLPTYITKSLNDGLFRFDNIAEGDYKIFALNDINHNLKFDLPNEDIGYLTETVKAFPMPIIDTTKKTDTVKLVDKGGDSLQVPLVELQTSKVFESSKRGLYLSVQNIFSYF